MDPHVIIQDIGAVRSRVAMRSLITAALALHVLVAAVFGTAAATQAFAISGRWVGPFSEDADGDGAGDFDQRAPQSREESARIPPGVNVVALSDGRVLYWEQLQGTENVDWSIAFQRPDPARSRTRTLDLTRYLAAGSLPRPHEWAIPAPEDAGSGDLTGSEQRHLANGQVIVVGGTGWSNEDASLSLPDDHGRTELYGLKSARIFDPAATRWERGADMNIGRYYPTLLTLPDARLIAIGGAERLLYNSSLVPGSHPPANAVPENVREPEVYDPRTNRWVLDDRVSARQSLPLFARMFLLPDSRLVYVAAGMLYAPGGGDHEARGWNDYKIFDPRTGSWTAAGESMVGVRSNALTVMLRLEPPYDQAHFLIAGGTVGPWPSGYVATSRSEILTWQRDSEEVAAETTSPLNEARWHSSSVVLPSGEVVALSGADRDEVVAPGASSTVRHAELFDPETGQWTRLAPGARDRTLHNTAVLLADGSVLVGGHAPAPRAYGTHGAVLPLMASNFKEPTFEIFQPPYLFRGPRPVIEDVATEHRESTRAFVVRTPDADDPTLQVVFSRLPAVTHTTDADQRTVVLEHRVLGERALRVDLPGRSILPPGPYYLFLLRDNGQGPTPSVARVILIGVDNRRLEVGATTSSTPAMPMPPRKATGGGKPSGRRSRAS